MPRMDTAGCVRRARRRAARVDAGESSLEALSLATRERAVNPTRF